MKVRSQNSGSGTPARRQYMLIALLVDQKHFQLAVISLHRSASAPILMPQLRSYIQTHACTHKHTAIDIARSHIKETSHVYSRESNPTRSRAEEVLGRIASERVNEPAHAILYSSGRVAVVEPSPVTATPAQMHF